MKQKTYSADDAYYYDYEDEQMLDKCTGLLNLSVLTNSDPQKLI